MYELTASDRERFEELGYLGPTAHPLLVPPFIDLVVSRFRALEPTTAMPTRPDKYLQRLDAGLRWWRGMHLEIPELWKIARHPALLDPMRSLLGPNIMFGGAWLMATMPGEVHGWHFDTEYQEEEPGLVVFVAMGVNERTPLGVISRSHRIDKQPSVWVSEGKRGLLDGGQLAYDDLVLEAAKKVIPEAELVRPPIKTGDFMITHGRLWHGVRNDSDEPRLGMVFFISRPTTHFRIVLSADAQPTYHSRAVACAMIEGSPEGAINEIVPPPVGA